MKKIFCITVFFVLSANVFAQIDETERRYLSQNAETLRFFDIAQKKYITLRAAFIGWSEQFVTIADSGTFDAQLRYYQRQQPGAEYSAAAGVPQGWTKWLQILIYPQPYATSFLLRTSYYDKYIADWKREPLSGLVKEELIYIFAAPSNKPSPFWFDEEGDYHIFAKMYQILN
jgi:hypothetical protein